MTLARKLVVTGAIMCLAVSFSPAGETPADPQISKIMSEVSEARIRGIVEKLVSFGTRNTMSKADDPVRGVGAARQWIFDQFKSYSPRLQVRFDQYRVKKQGRIFKDVDLYNVIAVLPGKTTPDIQVWISGHYDSLNRGAQAAGTPAGPADPATTPTTPDLAELEKNAELPAPGACDDGSGTAAVLELARVMSQYEFDKTLVFVTFAGEEQGLIGSSLQAAKSRREKVSIEAVLNNDIIGTEVSGNGRSGKTALSIYSDETPDSASQQLARYVREIGERYVPSMKVNTIFLGDRLGRGGDHTPFQWEGYAAVRFSTPNEIYANQHHDSDTLENMSVPYTAKVARVNAVVAASLAMAPPAPLVSTAEVRGTPARAGRPPAPAITRGASGYDAQLQWKGAGPEANIKGYAVLVRATTAPYWEREIYTGKVTEYLLKDLSIDDLKFGVRAIGTNGAESLVSPYVYAPRARTEIETVK